MSYFDDFEDSIINGHTIDLSPVLNSSDRNRGYFVELVRRNFTWTTKSGNRMKFSEMSVSHLSNVRKLILSRMRADHHDEQFRIVASAIAVEMGSRR